MKKNVRIFCAALTMSLCLGGLTACGGNAGEQPEATDAISEDVQVESSEEVLEDEDSEEDYSTELEGALKEGDAAPDFTAKLVDGTEFKMSDHNNEVVILNFFASWCGPCMNEMPAFEMLKKDGYTNLAILCVNCMEDKETVDALVKEEGFTFPIAYDEAGEIGNYYPTDGIPYTLIIKEGVIQKIFVGAADAETQHAEYKKAIDDCMK